MYHSGASIRKYMPISINCQMYKDGVCLHHAAPKPWFSKPLCIEINPPSSDPRIKHGCKLKYPFKRPDGFPLQPPARMVEESGRTTYAQFDVPLFDSLPDKD